MTNLDSIVKSRDITLPTEVRLVKNMTLQLNENEALLSVLLGPVRKYPYFLENMFRYVRLKSHGV